MSRYRQTMRDVLSEMVEKFSPKEIKMAIGIASDKRYAGGNMTGAVNAIEKIKKGLTKHKQVAAVLKRQNEDIQESGHDDVASAKNQVKVAMSALQKMETELGKLNDEDSLPTWWTNKVAIAVDKLDGMADYLDTQVEEVMMDLIQSLEERKMTDAEMDKREKIVLSLKKKKKEFKDRYGDDADSVMYATATKMAMKKEEVEIDEATGNEIKKYMKSKWNTDVKASKVGTGKSMRVVGKIPNDFRAHIAKQFYPDAKILDKNNIDFGQ